MCKLCSPSSVNWSVAGSCKRSDISLCFAETKKICYALNDTFFFFFSTKDAAYLK